MNRTALLARPALALAVVTAGVALVDAGLPAGAATTLRAPSAGEATSPTVAVNKQLATRIVDELAEGSTGIIRRAFATTYVDHAVPSLSGTAALTAAVKAQHAAHPKAHARIYRVVAEGDLVLVHSNLVLEPGTLGLAVMDIYRFSSGKVVEHWGGRQTVPAVTVSGHDMFSTLSAPVRLSPDPKASTADTLATLFGMFARATAGDLTALDEFIQPPYYQHNPTTADGVAAVKEQFGPLLTNPDIHLTSVLALAEGDLILTHSTLTGPGVDLMTFDLFRVRDKKIVEHWDVIQAV